VFVRSDKDVNVTSLQWSAEIGYQNDEANSLALGETDVLKVIATLPGVQTVGEGTLGPT